MAQTQLASKVLIQNESIIKHGMNHIFNPTKKCYMQPFSWEIHGIQCRSERTPFSFRLAQPQWLGSLVWFGWNPPQLGSKPDMSNT